MNKCVEVTVHTVLLQDEDKSRKSVAFSDLNLSFGGTKAFVRTLVL